MNCLEYSPSSQYLAAGTDKDIDVWDGLTGSLIVRLTGHTGIVMDVSWSPDGEYLASSSLDGDLMVWDMKTGQFAYSYELGADRVSSVSWNPDNTMLAAMISQPRVGQALVVVGRDGRILWSKALPGAGNHVDWSAKGNWLVAPTPGSQMVFTKWGHHVCNVTQPSWAAL